jgi:prevent-host-death family protein
VAKQYSIAQARDRLPAIVHEAELGDAIELTRRGKPVAVVMSLQEYRQVVRGHVGFTAAFEAFQHTVDLAALGVTDEDLADLRDRSPGRAFAW